jgi:Ca-activated chloride channel family protein
MITSIELRGQKAIDDIQAGNDLYKQKVYDGAELKYNEAISKEPSNATAKFNLANTMYRNSKQDEATKELDDLISTEKDASLRSRTYYNKGVILSAQKKLEGSIEAYKNTLRLNPADNDARENLQKALLELKKKNPPKKKDDKKKKQEQQKKQQQQPKMNQKEAQQRLKLLEQKEKEVQQRMQKEKSQTGSGQIKDW